jgi:hypothetical protein
MFLQDMPLDVAVKISIVELAIREVLLLASAGDSHTLLLRYG